METKTTLFLCLSEASLIPVPPENEVMVLDNAVFNQQQAIKNARASD